ncbi:MAG: PD-(D/E)XK nuclease family protein [Anaerolineae bacterium]
MEFYLAPVGKGKTDAVLQRIAEVKAEKPLASVWVLLATERQILDFRRRLLARDASRRVYFNVEVLNFYTLYQRIAALAGEPQRRLHDPARFELIRMVLRDTAANGDLPLLSSIVHTPGLARVCADFIYELKQSLIDVDMFTAAAAASGDQKQIALARIYAAYQRVLVENRLVDREGEGWVALSVMARDSTLGTSIDLLVCDGYDQFNLLQARLLTILGARAQASLTTLTTVPGREETIGLRFKRALDRLIGCHSEENIYYDLRWELFNTDTLPRKGGEPLMRLGEDIFLPDARPYQPATENVMLIEAPDPTSEIAAVLRRVKRLLLNGVRPDDVLIAVRDWNLYGRPLLTLARQYGLPVAMRGEPLIENPALAALIELLELPLNDFKRRELLDTLRSPYFDLQLPGDDAVDLLDACSRAALVTGARSDWLDCVRAGGGVITDEDDDRGEAAAIVLDEDTARLIRAGLERFFDGITPPESASINDYVRWLETLIGEDSQPDPDEEIAETLPAAASRDESSPNGVEHALPPYSLSMIAQVRTDGVPNALRARDLAALTSFKQILEGILNADTLVSALRVPKGSRSDGSRLITWQDFWAAVKINLAARTNRYGEMNASGRDGCVLATTITDARGLPHAHVFIPGLSEGVFPAPLPEDPLLLDSERRALSGYGAPLATSAERADEDGLFYELINLAGESLTLSRYTVKDGAPLLESHLWRAVLAVLPNAAQKRIKPGQIVDSEEAASVSEAEIAGVTSPETAAWIRAAHPVRWMQRQAGMRVEARRMARNIAHDHYTGVLYDRSVRDRVAELLNPNRIWSASQLTDYGTCPFRFYSRRILRLEPLKEPAEGMDALQFGNVVHDLLESVYKRITVIDADSLDGALRILDDEATKRLRTAPERFRFRRSPLWDQERVAIVRRVRKLMAADFTDALKLSEKFSGGERSPYRLETPFGGARGMGVLDIGSEQIRVNGRIDRIDRLSNGDGNDRLIVIDYKTGTTRIDKDEIERGRNFQMMLYVRMAEAMAAEDHMMAAGGAFVHITNQKTSGLIDVRMPEDAAVIDHGMAHLAAHLQAGRHGNFAVRASKVDGGRCAHSCDYHQFCRMAIIHRNKRLPL